MSNYPKEGTRCLVIKEIDGQKVITTATYKSHSFYIDNPDYRIGGSIKKWYSIALVEMALEEFMAKSAHVADF